MENEVLEAIKNYDDAVRNLIPMETVGDIVQAGIILKAANEMRRLLLEEAKEK